MQTWNKIQDELKGDKVIWLIMLVLSLFSIMAVYSATSSMAFVRKGGNTEFYMMRHGIFLIVGLILTYICYRIPYQRFSTMAPYLFAVTIPLLLFTFFMGAEVNDARRWISLPGGFTFQTSDFAKLALVIYIAKTISVKQDVIDDFKEAFLPIIVPILMVTSLIAPADLSTAGLLFFVCFLMMIIGRVSWKYIALLVLLAGFAMACLIIGGEFFPDHIRVGTWTSRIQEFFFNADGGYQVQQAKIAIADGELFGVGPGNSVQRNYLPSPYADFIYAIICEEYGLLGGLVVISMYLLFFWRCVSIITRSQKTFGAMLVLGLGLLFTVQAFANMAVSTHFMPVTGLTLPMISMGGTSILATCVAVGIILSVSKYIEKTA